jgi:8-oxo-dGTP pyrophosphatase MutT (NUDIX family)
VIERGGPQNIPRPPSVRAGQPAPWAALSPDDRVITTDDLRRVFTDRQGAPSFIEHARSGGLALRGVQDTMQASAVLAPFYEHAGEPWVVLTRRSWDLRSHTGEVSFPGGRVEPGESPIAGALREAKEEIGLDPSSVEVLGELDHLMTVTSRSFIVPFVGLLAARPELTASPREVDEVLHVPVRELLLDEVYREERWTFTTPPAWAPPEIVELGGPIERPIFFFELVGDTLWGATAAMLRHLLSLALGLPVGIDHA